MSEHETPLSRIRILADVRDGGMPPEGTDGVIAAAGYPLPSADDRRTWLLAADPADAPAWSAREGTWWVGRGLTETLACRERWPDLPWVPCITAQRAVVRYHMTGRYPGEGFRVYQPDTRALTGYEVVGEDSSMAASLRRAWEEGFRLVWVHDATASAAAGGPDLNILERVRAVFDGQIILSGDVRTQTHLERLVGEPNLVAVAMPGDALAGQDTAALVAALEPTVERPPAEASAQGEVA